MELRVLKFLTAGGTAAVAAFFVSAIPAVGGLASWGGQHMTRVAKRRHTPYRAAVMPSLRDSRMDIKPYDVTWG